MVNNVNNAIKAICYILLFAGSFFIGGRAGAEGASLYLSPSVGTYPIGTVFEATVRIDTGGAVINSAEGSLIFDKAKIEVAGLSYDSSIFNLWLPKKPSYSNSEGRINFSGGLPQPGYKGSGGQAIIIKFKAKSAGDAQVNFVSGAILANDGSGSNVLTSLGGGSFKISPEVIAPKSETTVNTDSDQTQPGPGKTTTKEEGKQENVKISGSSIITSSTHSDQSVWYSSGSVALSWILPDDAEGVSYLFDNKINSDPGSAVQEKVSAKNYDNIKDGVWYFHLKIKTNGAWSEVYNFRVQIDTTPPSAIDASIEQDDPDNWPTLYFKTKDNGSGLHKYEIKIGSLEEKAYETSPEAASMTASGLEAGDHTALIKAIDKAGNESIREINFTIKPIETPKIEYLPEEIKPSDRLFLSGKALPEVAVHAFISNEDGKTETISGQSDKNGNWHLVYGKKLENGRYFIWTEAENANGLRSDPSVKASFLVTPPVFARLGDMVINYFTVIASLIFVIILIVFMLVFLVSFARKKLRKETFEIEKVLNDKLEELKKEVEDEFAKLSKIALPAELRKERVKVKARINNKIESAERKILKEVKDVEDMLK